MNPAIFRQYDRAALDRQYDNALKIGADALQAHRARWAEQSARARDTISCVLDVPYGRAAGEQLDIFRPRFADLAPVQIYIHGGYWISNDKGDCSYVALGFTAAGFLAVVINYDLIPNVAMAEQIRQCRAAVGWVHAHIREYGGDPDQIYVTGHSAGGHLAVSLLTDPDIVRARIKGVTSLSGVYDLEPVRLSYVNDKLGLTEHEAVELSPVRLRPCDTSVPLLLTMGAREGDEYIRQHNDLAAAWRPAMPHLVAPIIPDTDHFTMRAALDDPSSDICRLIWKTMGKGTSDRRKA
ncbi:MAG: alpha/beta hydrolase [Xanthobacteraceae bacterium]